jgi:heme/copper-type cytochrome/quinol oxidase subunit 3
VDWEEETAVADSTADEFIPKGIVNTREEAAYELRADENAIFIGSRLFIGVVTFAYASLAFCYFYLRSANNEDFWRPHRITAPTSLGAAIFVVTVATALVNWYGSQRLKHGFTTDWLVAGWAAVGGALLAIGLQIFEYTQLPFFPGSSAYASCFVGWGILNTAGLVVAAYWLETTLARAIRLRRALAEDGGAARSGLPAGRVLRANIESMTYFWAYIAAIGVLFWVLFYMV